MYFNAGTIYNIAAGQGIINPAAIIKQTVNRLQSQIRLNDATARALKMQNELNILFTKTADMETYMSNLLNGLQEANAQAIAQAEQNGGKRPAALRGNFALSDSSILGVKSTTYSDMFTASGKERLGNSQFFALLNNVRSLNGKLLEAALQRIVGTLVDMYDQKTDDVIQEVLEVLKKDMITGQSDHSNIDITSLTKTAGSKTLSAVVNFNGTDKKLRFNSAQKSDAIIDIKGWQNGTDIVKTIGVSAKNMYGLDKGINIAQHVNFIAMIENSDLFGNNIETSQENFFWRTFFTINNESNIFSKLKFLRQLIGVASISGHHGSEELKSQFLITVVRTAEEPFRVIPIYDRLLPLMTSRDNNLNILQIIWEIKNGLPLHCKKKNKSESLNDAAFRALSTIKYTASLQLTQTQYDSMLK